MTKFFAEAAAPPPWPEEEEGEEEEEKGSSGGVNKSQKHDNLDGSQLCIDHSGRGRAW